jgi:iron(III) transport system ATP-binding protein
LRLALREEVVAILRAARASTLVVTHDQEEALSISDAVVVLREGRVVQSGAPEELYAHPSSRWVAEFVGDADVLPGTASGGVVDCELGRFATDATLTGAVDVVVRPEALTLAALDGDDRCGATRTGGVRATVVGRSFYGADQLVRLRLASGTEVRCRTIGGPQWQQGDDVHVEVAGAPTVMVADPVREDDS